MQGVRKITHQVNRINTISKLTLLGAPGCDGLGPVTMSTFEKALTACESDGIVILGDLVQRGIHAHYQSVSSFINNFAPVVVYALCGRHDTSHYRDYFGLRNYILHTDQLLLLFLDNGKGSFDQETLDFAQSMLANHHRPHIVVFFHQPPPNNLDDQTMDLAQWNKLRQLLDIFRPNIDLIVCGHHRGYYQTTVDDYPLVVTGGAGAKLDPKQLSKSTGNHVVILDFDQAGCVRHSYLPLSDTGTARPQGLGQ